MGCKMLMASFASGVKSCNGGHAHKGAHVRSCASRGTIERLHLPFVEHEPSSDSSSLYCSVVPSTICKDT